MKYIIRIVDKDQPLYVGDDRPLEADPYRARAFDDFDKAHDVVEQMRIERLPGLAEVIPHPADSSGPNLLAIATGILGLILGVILSWAFGGK